MTTIAPHLPDQIEHLPTEALVPYARNSRTHSPEQVAQIAASIKEFGFTNPVLIDANNTLIAGHGRVMAAQSIGVATVPAIRLAHLTDAQRRAYVIADNKLAENAGWDMATLAREVEDLTADGFELDLLGFGSDELTALLGEYGQDAAKPGDGLTDPDEAPAVQATPVTKLGDVWVMGKHRLMCGDSTSHESVGALMQGEKADLCFTDPPYGVSYDGGHTENGRFKRDKLENDGSAAIYSGVLPVVFGSTKKTAALYLWFSDSKSAAVTAAVTAAGYEVRNTLVWNKSLAQFGAIGAQYKSKHEPCLYCFKKGSAPLWCGPTNEVSVWDVKRENKNEFHPTQKPVELAERAMGNSSVVGATVLDVFGGSGSTLIACEKNNRIARLMELDHKYCDVIVRRWQSFTGKQATLESTGQTFEQVQAKRLSNV